MTTRTAKIQLNESIATRERWQAEDETARLNLADLRSRPVDLSDVEGAFTLAAERAAARQRDAICADALVEARAAELRARRSAVVAEADALAPVSATARKALDDFNARTDELLAPWSRTPGGSGARSTRSGRLGRTAPPGRCASRHDDRNRSPAT